MPAHNFWYWIIQSAVDFLIQFFLPFLPLHVNWGIAQAVAQDAQPILTVVFIGAGAFVNLATLVRLILLMVVMETVQLIFAARKIVAKLIKIGLLVGLLE
jgi:hypothetical protein